MHANETTRELIRKYHFIVQKRIGNIVESSLNTGFFTVEQATTDDSRVWNVSYHFCQVHQFFLWFKSWHFLELVLLIITLCLLGSANSFFLNKECRKFSSLTMVTSLSFTLHIFFVISRHPKLKHYHFPFPMCSVLKSNRWHCLPK